MARLTHEQAKAMATSSKSDWFKLENDKDTAFVQFPYFSKDDICTESVHETPIEGRNFTKKISCLRTPEESIEVCPLCDAGLATRSTVVLQLYNHSTERVENWERGINWVEKKIHSLMDSYGEEFPYYVFQIQRIGAKGYNKTDYAFSLMPNRDPVEITECEFTDPLGTVISTYSYEDMQYYCQNGVWPEDNASAAPAQARQSPARPAPTAPVRRPAPVVPRPQAPAAAPRTPAAPPAAPVRRAPVAQSVPRGGARVSRADQGGAEEQF